MFLWSLAFSIESTYVPASVDNADDNHSRCVPDGNGKLGDNHLHRAGWETISISAYNYVSILVY